MGRPSACGSCGKCAKCERAAYMRGWYRSGHAEQQRQSQKASRARRLEAARAYDRQRGFRIYNRAAVEARRALNHAVTAGRLTKDPCEVCGTTERVDGHHDDYSKPLDVQWLCHAHHMELHHRAVA